jgi:hypothetical protein
MARSVRYFLAAPGSTSGGSDSRTVPQRPNVKFKKCASALTIAAFGVYEYTLSDHVIIVAIDVFPVAGKPAMPDPTSPVASGFHV